MAVCKPTKTKKLTVFEALIVLAMMGGIGIVLALGVVVHTALFLLRAAVVVALIWAAAWATGLAPGLDVLAPYF